MRHQEARAEVLRFHHDAGRVVGRLAAGLADDCGEQQVALERNARGLDRLAGDHEGRHRPLVVDDALADELVPFDPGFVKNVRVRIAPAPDVGRAHRRVHVAVEQQTVAAARARKLADHVEAVRQQSDLPDLEALGREPVAHALGHRPLRRPGAVDVADLERQVDQFFFIDARHRVLIQRHPLLLAIIAAISP